jgi:branched-chain amino acid transport system ATP-binding protein
MNARPPALRLEDVHKSFGATSVIKGVTLQVAAGERHAIIGPNGAGKSTLFHLITGRFAANAGRMFLNGEDITGHSAHAIYRRGLARSFQVTSLFNRLSVFENLRVGAMRVHGAGHSFWRALDRYRALNERAEKMLEMLGLERRRDMPAGLLAYAEQRALEIGLAIVGGAHTILLDEPTAGMSHAETERAVALIRKVTEGRTLVMVEHDMAVVFDLADRISVLADGQVIASGPPDAVRGDPAVHTAYLGTAAEVLT